MRTIVVPYHKWTMVILLRHLSCNREKSGMSYQPTKRMIIDVYTDNIEGKLRVSANTEDEALKIVQKMGFNVRSMMSDCGLSIKLPPRTR